MSFKKEAWVIIPARGGSKGIPRKNVKALLGKPLISYAIKASLGAGGVKAVYVTTDDSEIAAVSREYGAEVIDRPAALSGDEASSESALLHALEALRKAHGKLPDAIVFVQCTSPFTLSEDIEKTLELVLNQGADSAFTAVPSHAFLWKRGKEGFAIGVNHDPAVRPRRQDREPEFRETGAVYAFRTEGFLSAKHRFFGKTMLHEVPASRGLDIDDEFDFQLAEKFLQDR